MHKSPSSIANLFQIPARFIRSVQLEDDFFDPAALDNYVATPHVVEAFTRIVSDLRASSGRRAWRLTGDYGVGKSSFALALAHVLAGSGSIPSLALKRPGKSPVLWPILLTGSREPLLAAIARGIAHSLRQLCSADRKRRTLVVLAEQADAAAASNNQPDVLRLIENVRNHAAADGAGILLIIDELGKFLEYAALHPDREDVFVLQRLAEVAARSANKPFLVLGLLHQGFQAYAERLPSTTKHEWEKVAGRFDEIVFNQPLAHAAALISGSLNIDTKNLSGSVRAAAHIVTTAAEATCWLGNAGSNGVDAAKLYPLHPTVIPALIRFFARFGENERSLFGFLLSSDPFGLQSFAFRAPGPEVWYGLAELYDYVRTAFGHRLAGASYRNHWLRILETIDAAGQLNALELRVLKAVAILNLIDADDLLPTEATIQAAFAPINSREIIAALNALKKNGLLFERGLTFRLWPNGSSVRLETTLGAAFRAVGPVETVAAGIDPYLDHDPILARRHYLESGTLRYFEMRYALATSLTDALKKPTDADGLVVIALADTNQERRVALHAAAAPPFTDRPDVVIGVVQPLLGLAPELQDVRCWQWLVDHTPELADDAYAAAEAARQLAIARRALAGRLNSYLGLRAGTAAGVVWFRLGKEVIPPTRGGLSGMLSTFCDQMFACAPLIANELLNRNALSSAAAAARMRLIEGLFTATDKPFLGIDPNKAPPEKSMYLSVLHKGGIHVRRGDRFALTEPDEGDLLRLRPALAYLAEAIESAHGDRVSVPSLLEGLRRPPFGVRAGVSPLLLAMVLCTRSHELAVYDQGTFLHHFGPTDFLRMTKSPAAFEIQHCRVAGVRLEVFNQLAAAFSRDQGCRPELLDVVRPLCQFAAQLTDFTRRTSSLSQEAAAVRETLLSAREPATMLFRDLPMACGIRAFTSEENNDDKRVKQFVTTLHDAVGELRAAYPALLDKIIACVAEALGGSREDFDRARIASRAARVSLAAREPRLRTFALRLRDPGLSDEAWAESLASFIVAKPPARWLSADEARFTEEVGTLAELFHKVEATAFHNNATQPAVAAIRLNLTRGDGVDLVRIIEPSAEGEDLHKEIEALRGRFPKNKSLRLQMITQLLWNELNALTDQQALSGPSTYAAKRRHQQ